MMRKLLCLWGVMLLVCGVGALPALTDYGNTTSLKINITQSMGAQTDYQMKFILSNSSGISNYYAPDNVIYTNGTTRPDWYDINVTDNADAPLPFWIENNTATSHNATVWVKVPTIATDNSSGLKWRYGNASQSTSTMDGLNTFSMFDDFSSNTLNTTQWKDNGGNTISNGILSIAGAGANRGVNSTGPFYYATNYSVLSRATLPLSGINGDTQGIGFLLAGSQAFGASGDGAFLTDYPTTNKWGISNGTGSNVYEISSTYPGYHIWEPKRVGGGSQGIVFYIDGIVVGLLKEITPLTSISVKAISYHSGTTVLVDWIVVKKSLSTEPTTSSYSVSGSISPPIASFTCTPTTAMLGTSIACTDTSTNIPTNWTYYWGDGNLTDGTQNPSYTYPFTGTFSINQTVNNTAGSSWYNRSNYITITNVSGFTQQDLWQTGHYTKTLHITDSSSNAPIPVVVVTDDNGQSYTTTNGTAYFTEDAGDVVFYFAATGYVSKSASFIIDGDSTDTVQMVASGGAPQQNTWYTPWQVRIRIVDYYGAPLPNINVTANYIASSLPSTDTTWLVSAFGINTNVANDMLDSSVAMAGNTDDNGGLSFTMFKSIQYRLTITNSTLSVASTKTLYPSDQEYVIYVRTAGQTAANNTLAMRNGTLPWYSVNSTHINLNMTYVDTSLCTSQLIFRVWFRDNGTEIHNTTWSGFGASYVYDNHTVPKAPIGTEYLWGYNATTVC